MSKEYDPPHGAPWFKEELERHMPECMEVEIADGGENMEFGVVFEVRMKLAYQGDDLPEDPKETATMLKQGAATHVTNELLGKRMLRL